jgi:hypothetical protein
MVEIGNVPGSYLAIKMLPDGIVQSMGASRSGGKMPLGVDPFPQDSATIIYWIAGGEVEGFEGSSESGGTGAEPEPCFGVQPGDDPLSFETHVWPVLEARCQACHGTGAMAGAPMEWSDATEAHAALVGQASDGVPMMSRVTGGDPLQSLLWHKVAGTQALVGDGGDRMPADGSTLCGEDALLIHQWILDGAAP